MHEMGNEMLITVEVLVGQEVLSLAATDAGHEELAVIGIGDM